MSASKFFSALLFSLLASSAFASTDFLVVSDPHLNASVTKTKLHSVLNDTGLDLWQASLDSIKTTVRARPVSFALLLGDLPAHHLSEPLKSNSEQQVLSDLRKTLGKVPIVYIPGNNDPLGGNYHSYTETASDTNAHRPDELDRKGAWPAHGYKLCSITPSKSCVVDNGPEAQASPYFYGSYSVYPLKNHTLRVIALNSIPFVANNNASYQSDDGQSQAATIKTLTAWLNAELESATKNHERVIIAMHIPPGLDAYKRTNMWEPAASTAFMTSMQKYHDTIIGVFAGHTHYDEVRFIRDNTTDPSTLVLMTPGIDTGHGNNPGYKIVSLNDDFEISNATTYAGDEKLNFTEQFNYQTAYQSHCTKDLSLHACLDKLDANNQFFALMQQHYAVGNADYTHWGGVEEAMHVSSTQ